MAEETAERFSPGNEMDEKIREEVVAQFNYAVVTKHLVSPDEIARHLKDVMDKKHYGNWHCIVGKDFGSCVTGNPKKHLMLQIGPWYVELWRCDLHA